MELMILQIEENYFKVIYKIQECVGKLVSMNVIVVVMNISVVLVMDMIKCLFEKDLVNYERY